MKEASVLLQLIKAQNIEQPDENEGPVMLSEVIAFKLFILQSAIEYIS